MFLSRCSIRLHGAVAIKQIEKHITILRITRIPGSEPVLLDLEKLFLLSDSMENLKLYRNNEISEPDKKSINKKIIKTLILRTYIPEKLAIYAVVHEESEFSGPRT